MLLCAGDEFFRPAVGEEDGYEAKNSFKRLPRQLASYRIHKQMIELSSCRSRNA